MVPVVFDEELKDLERRQLLRNAVEIGSWQGSRVSVNGKELLLFCSNDYLGLASHPALVRAASDAMERFGFGTGASRLVSGSSHLHRELEEALARFKNADDAILFNSGYTANTSLIPAIAGEGDAIFSDSLNHASIIDGCRLSRARTFVYRHRDAGHLEELLKQSGNAKRKLIVTDGVFSMDGDLAPLPDIVAAAERYGAIVMLDDAHATGVLGGQGRGTAEHFGLKGRVHIQMGTLGKAFGSFGAYAAGDRDLIAYLRNKARGYIYSTALPSAVCAASLAALSIITSEPERRNRIWKNRQTFVEGLNALGITVGPSESPIIPLVVGDSGRTLDASRVLMEEGVFASAIRPPTVPEGTARIRATLTAIQSEDDINQALKAFSRLKKEGYL